VLLTKPKLKEPFPDTPEIWTCPKAGLKVPKRPNANVEWRERLLAEAENDPMLQTDLLAACNESLLFWINAFVWTFHQFDVEGGERVESEFADVPFITWEIQDTLFNDFQAHLKKGEDILIDKSRDMGASWCCTAYLHYLWLFRSRSQLLEMSRVREYVDQTGNMKALFQKHDYINKWLPEWMCPPDTAPGQKYRSKMHMLNPLNQSCIDGESTTEHAASGDRRLIILLDEFAKVENGAAMRSATRDAALMRIINSTPAGAGTEYSRWKKSGKIKVFILPFWEHPDKGANRYLKQNDITGDWEIRSPWFDKEEEVRSPKELAQEVLRKDLEAGDTFFSISNIEKHMAIFGAEPKSTWNIHLNKEISDDGVLDIIRRRDISAVKARQVKNGQLKMWCELPYGRPDQTKTYVMGIDLGKGQGATPSVISIKCKETGEKIGEWYSNVVPPYEMARIAAAVALWIGGANPKRIPFMKWEMNGPGWDFGKLMVKDFHYPHYYVDKTIGKVTDRQTQKYGWHSSRDRKAAILYLYDRMLAHGGYVNHSLFGLEQAKYYIHYPGGGIGPSELADVKEELKKTHGDIVIADALTLDDKGVYKPKYEGPKLPVNSCGYRKQKVFKTKVEQKKRAKQWRRVFDFSKTR